MSLTVSDTVNACALPLGGQSVSWVEKLLPVCLLLLVCACSHGQSYALGAAEGMRALQAAYDPATGLYRTTGWWNSANAITVFAEYASLAHDPNARGTLERTFTRAQRGKPEFLNEYYDDEGWWALAWIQAYDVTHSAKYLRMAETIFDDMSTGWDESTCSGGLWWTKRKTYKNAIANELFLSLAAHLANRTAESRKQYFRGWAAREWRWFLQSGLINSDGLINDGLDEQCQNNHGEIWSYNQGVILGAAAELPRGDSQLPVFQVADRIARAAITHLVNRDGILRDPCEPRCDEDAMQFKGIFIRNLLALHAASPEPTYASFILRNADSILSRDRLDEAQFGLSWSGPYYTGNTSTQSSALDAIVAAAQLTQGTSQSTQQQSGRRIR